MNMNGNVHKNDVIKNGKWKKKMIKITLARKNEIITLSPSSLYVCIWTVYLVSAYAPTLYSIQDIKDEFYDQIDTNPPKRVTIASAWQPQHQSGCWSWLLA